MIYGLGILSVAIVVLAYFLAEAYRKIESLLRSSFLLDSTKISRDEFQKEVQATWSAIKSIEEKLARTISKDDKVFSVTLRIVEEAIQTGEGIFIVRRAANDAFLFKVDKKDIAFRNKSADQLPSAEIR